MLVSLTATPLPEDFTHFNPNVVSAHTKCRDCERRLLCSLEGNAPGPSSKSLINIRILGYLLHYGPTEQSIAKTSQDIVSCETDEDLINLGEFLDNYYLRTFRASKGATPATSDPPSRSEVKRLDLEQDMLDHLGDYLYPKTDKTAKNSALLRDNYRCVITDWVDVARWDEKDDGQWTKTNCAHIFSKSTNLDLDNPAKMNHTSTAWHVLERFGVKNILEELAGEKVHSLTNILTLDASVHTAFDQFDVWFKADSESQIPNRYEIMSTKPFVFSRKTKKEDPFVTLASTDPRLALPSPLYLRMHASCCQIAHMSGAAAYYKLLDDGDDDGFSERQVVPEVLTARLHELRVRRLGLVEPM